MRAIAANVSELVGGTPVVALQRVVEGHEAEVFAKLEAFNPGGSVKDRIGVAMIEAAEREGRIEPGRTTIVEATSGNTGIALAFVCAAKGYDLVLTLPQGMSREREGLLRLYGAQVRVTESMGGMTEAVEAARALATRDDVFLPDQFSNPANPEIHRQTTGPELWDALDGRIDVFIAGVGTGGTITGVGEVLKERNPDCRIIAVEPRTSAVLSGGRPGPHKIQGIGAGFVPAGAQPRAARRGHRGRRRGRDRGRPEAGPAGGGARRDLLRRRGHIDEHRPPLGPQRGQPCRGKLLGARFGQPRHRTRGHRGESGQHRHGDQQCSRRAGLPQAPRPAWLPLRGTEHPRGKADQQRPDKRAQHAEGPASWLITHSSHAAAAYIGKASAWRSTSIQRPGRGSARASPGTSARTRYGAARPSPIVRNTSSVTAAGAASAAAIAAAMNGAVQGVATRTASRPVKKLPRCPPRPAMRCPAPVSPPPTSNTPERFRPTPNNTHAIPATKAGDWNWNPHPAAAPPARATTSAPPSAPKVARTPTAYDHACGRIRPRAVPSASPIAFIASTGNTHGIRFRTSPPRNARPSNRASGSARHAASHPALLPAPPSG